MEDIAIEVSKITKLYKIYDNPIDRIKEAFFLKRKKLYKEYYALKEVSFTIKKGESVGIIGKNGSGKSTLLKIITGVLAQTKGELRVNGRISALLELGAGFNPEYTGIENIYLSGTIIGYSKEEMDSKLQEIIEFADIGDFIHQPVKNYSSGMFVRLAFAVAINVDPEILIIDEALSVGDIRFQQKCLRKIEELKKDKTILFVSHDLVALSKFCDRIIWINDGHIVAQGEPNDIIKQYQAFMAGSEISYYDALNDDKLSNIHLDFGDKVEVDKINSNLQMFGDGKAKIIGISMYDQSNRKIYQVSVGQIVKLFIKVLYYEYMDNPIIGFTIKDRIGNIVTQTNSYVLQQNLGSVESNEMKVYCFEFRVPNLKSGDYTISPALASGTQYAHIQHCWVHDAFVIKVNDGQLYNLEGYLVLNEVNFTTV